MSELIPSAQSAIDRALGIGLSPAAVRKAAAVALAEHGIERAIGVVQNGNDRDAVNAIKVLGEIGVGQKTEVIIGHMDVLEKVARAAASVLPPDLFEQFKEALRKELEDS